MKRLRVLWLSHFIPYPPLSGAVQRSYHLLKWVSQRHDVTVLALSRKSLLETVDAERKAIEAIGSLGIRIRGFRPAAESSRGRWLLMMAASVAGPRPFTVNWLASRPFAEAIREQLESGGYDLIHVDTIALMAALDATSIPIVLNHHNAESQMLVRRSQRTPFGIGRWLLAREAVKVAKLERTMCRAVAANLVVSALDGERLAAIEPGIRWTVVENGVDVQGFAPPRENPARDPAELAFTGTMSWYPNEDAMRYFLERIWPALNKKDPSFRLTIAGRGPGKKLQDLAAADARVSLTGEVPDVRPYLHRAGIYVCPVRDGGGTRLKVLEAMAAGIPLVATALAMEGLAVEPHQHYIPAESVDEFVEGILRLRTDPQARLALSEAGRRLVAERYDWPVCGSHLERAFWVAAGGGSDQA